MSRQQNRAIVEMEGLIPKIRKRGCSTSSSSSSKVHNYRFKRTILVGKKARGGIGLGGSRSCTPVPTWKMTPLRSAIDSPRYSQKSNGGGGGGGGGRSGPVSARRLAATLWEMNEIPTPAMSENLGDKKKNKNALLLKKEKSRSSVPSHLSDPSHSPISEVCMFIIIIIILKFSPFQAFILFFFFFRLMLCFEFYFWLYSKF